MNVVVSVTEYQKDHLPQFPFRKVRAHLQQRLPLPPPNETAGEAALQPKTERFAGSLTPVLHLRLKTLASEVGCSMSQAVVRILQLPE